MKDRTSAEQTDEPSQNSRPPDSRPRLGTRVSPQDEKSRARVLKAMDPDPGVAAAPGMTRGSGVREEAAALYAAGRHQDASQVLTSAMQASRGQVSTSLWYMLFDIYQATGQKLAFERLASLFAQAFEKSPPSWSNEDVAKVQGAGRNVMVVEGPISAINQDKLVDFIHSARAARTARLDLSRATLGPDASSRRESMASLVSMLSRLRRYKVPTLLMGDLQLLEQAEALRNSEEGEANAAWMMTFELLQWHGQEERFEELALRYAVKFEESAPGYEAGQALAVVPGEDKDLPPETSGHVLVPARIDATNIEKFLLSIDHAIRATGKAQIDAAGLKLMTYDAATRLAAYLSSLGLSPQAVEVSSPCEAVMVLLEMAGASDFMHISPRKR